MAPRLVAGQPGGLRQRPLRHGRERGVGPQGAGSDAWHPRGRGRHRPLGAGRRVPHSDGRLRAPGSDCRSRGTGVGDRAVARGAATLRSPSRRGGDTGRGARLAGFVVGAGA